MHSGLTRRHSAALLGAVAVVGLSTAATWSQAVVPPAAIGASSNVKELEVAVTRVREGMFDQALGHHQGKGLQTS